MGIEIYQVDAFTDRPFRGNPAAVCLLPGPAKEAWMQNVALEMNLSDTAFIHRESDGFGLRWFTPAVEVELCGHATLATAHTLWEARWLRPEEQARFHTASGLLTAERQGQGIALDFPALPEEPARPPEGLLEALGVTPLYVGKTPYDYLIEAESEETVRALNPDHGWLRSLGIRGVMVTARAQAEGLDFVSRFFAPGAGIDEDPVTGSSHCCLGPYWSRLLGKDELVAYQASPRGGTVRVRVEGHRVRLIGQAVTIMRGELIIG